MSNDGNSLLRRVVAASMAVGSAAVAVSSLGRRTNGGPPAVEDPPARTPLGELTTSHAPAAPATNGRGAGPEPTGRDEAAEDSEPVAWRRLSIVFLIACVGLLTMTVGNALSREGRDGAEELFWAGFLMIVVPVAALLVSRRPGRLERALAVTTLGIVLYLSKVLHDPFGFTFSDELVHARNAEDILRMGGLFPENSILPVTTVFPGLASVTAGLAELAGVSVFAAGVVVIGVARLTLMATLFLLFERVTGSSRVAGLAALIYAANPNFLFWSGQYSYQSLAVPLGALAVLAVADRRRHDGGERRLALMGVFLVTFVAVALTHHLTSQAVALLLAAVCVIALATRRRWEAAWGYAAFATVVAIALRQVPETGGYLSQITDTILTGVTGSVEGTDETRTLFESEEGDTAPLLERAIGILSVLLIVGLLPFGLRRIPRRPRLSLLAALGAAAVTYIAILPLRLVPAAWELANRASDFLFVGVGVTVALGLLFVWRPTSRTMVKVAAVAAIAVMAAGGAIAGWPPSVRLSQPLVATVNGHRVEPQGFALAEWSTTLGPDRRMVADQSNARLLLTSGGQLPFAPPEGIARAVLEPVEIEEIRPTLEEESIGYVVVDRREIADDPLAGYFFAPAGRSPTDALLPPDQIAVFDVAGADRLFDSGDIVAYDVRGLVE